MQNFDQQRSTVPLWKDLDLTFNIVSAPKIGSILQKGLALSKPPHLYTLQIFIVILLCKSIKVIGEMYKLMIGKLFCKNYLKI